MRSSSLVAFCSLPFVVSSCVPTLVGLPGDHVVPAGFVCTATPSEAYGPGYVFRVDQTGAELLVSDLGAIAQTHVFAAALPVYDATVSRSVGLSFDLKIPNPAISNAEASAAAATTSHASFGQGRFVLMTDAGVASLLSEINGQVFPKPGSRYFVVRDTVQAKTVDLRFSRSDELRLGGQVTIASLLSGSPSLSLKRDSQLVLSASFDTPLNVCVRAVELIPGPDGSEFSTVSESGIWTVSERPLNARDVDRTIFH